MKLTLINNSKINYRMYIVKNGKKIFKKKINVENNDCIEIHFDELKNMNKIFLGMNRLLFGLANCDSNGDAANLVVNNDVYVAKLNCGDIDELVFSIDEKNILSCNENVQIFNNARKNDNPRTAPVKSFFYIMMLLIILCAVIALAFYLAGGPF